MNEPEGQFWLVYVIFWARHSRHVVSAGQDANADDLREPRTPMHTHSRHATLWKLFRPDSNTSGMLQLSTIEGIACDLCLLKIASDLKLVMWKCDVYIRSESTSALAAPPDAHHELDVKFADSSEAEMRSVLRVFAIHNPLISCGKSTFMCEY